MTSPHDGPRDEGFTLIELTVGMVVLSFFLAIFTGALVQLFHSTNSVETTSTAQTQQTAAFLRLDRQIRYADAVTTPGQAGGDWYVEFRTSVTGSPVCTQLRVSTSAGQLQSRTWIDGSVTTTAWSVLATGVSGSTPFTLLAPSGGYGHQRLTIALTSGARSGQYTFSALNTGRTTVGSVCANERPAA